MSALVRRKCHRGFNAFVYSISCGIILVIVLFKILQHQNNAGQVALEESHCRGEFLKRSNHLTRPKISSLTKQAGEVASMLGGLEYAQETPGKRKEGCQFRYLKKPEIVECLDNFRSRRLRDWSKFLNTTVDRLTNRPLHIAFFGDSRVRQHFFSLLQMLPTYDVKVSSFDPELHIDRYTKSETLNVVVSFSWRPSLVAGDGINITKTLKRWIDYRHFLPDDVVSNTPDFLLTGGTLHDMLKENNGTIAAYARALWKLKPLLSKISERTRVIWYNTYPTGDLTFKGWQPRGMSLPKIHQYNEIARSILKDSPVEIWDSTDPLVEEYNRACALFIREAEDLWGVSSAFKCKDYAHAGSAAVTPSTHILLNELCHSTSSHTF